MAGQALDIDVDAGRKLRAFAGMLSFQPSSTVWRTCEVPCRTLIYLAFSHDEQIVECVFPKEARNGLIE